MTGWQKVGLIIGISLAFGIVYPIAEMMWMDWRDRRLIRRHQRAELDRYLRSIEPTMTPLPRRRHHHGLW